MRENIKSVKIYHLIKEQLLEMESGDHVSIRNFAIKFGSSYTPAREAILRLEKEGLLRHIPNVGFFVVNSNVNDLNQIYQVRKCIEDFTLSETFSSITSEDIRIMKEISIRHTEQCHSNNYEKAIDLDIAFHSYLVHKFNNDELTRLYDKTRQQYKRYMIKKLHSLFSSAHAIENVNSSHMPFIEAIESGNLSLALSIQQEHLQQGLGQIVSESQ